MVTVMLFALVFLLVGISGVLVYKGRDGWPIFLILGCVIAYFGLLSGVMK